MTAEGERRLHSRLDDVVSGLGDIKEAVAASVAVCEVCRPMVLGNGGKSIDKRVTTLETISRIRGRGFWALIALLTALAGATAGIVGSIGVVVLRWALGTG